MKSVSAVLVLLAVSAACAGCDEKKEAPDAAPSAAPVVSSAPPVASSAPPPAASSAAAPASSSSMVTGDATDVVLTVKDPVKEPEKTIKTQPGGSLTLFLPDYPGTVWSLDTNDKTLGKAKEEVIPGFAPQTNGHQFKWAPLPKSAGKHKVQLVNKKIGDKAAKPTQTFALEIDVG